MGSRDPKPPPIGEIEASREYFVAKLKRVEQHNCDQQDNSDAENGSGDGIECLFRVAEDLRKFFKELKEDGMLDFFWEDFLGFHYWLRLDAAQQRLDELKVLLENGITVDMIQKNELIRKILHHANIERMRENYEEEVLRIKSNNRFRELTDKFPDATDREISTALFSVKDQIRRILADYDQLTDPDIDPFLSLIEKGIQKGREVE